MSDPIGQQSKMIERQLRLLAAQPPLLSPLNDDQFDQDAEIDDFPPDSSMSDNMLVSAEDIPSPKDFTFTSSDVRLKITYKGSLAYAHVSSRAMAHASPVWEKFLFPPWYTTNGPVEELDFTDDDADALLVVLHVTHHKTKDIPCLLPPQRLLINLAIICDKYICPDLVRPWVVLWVESQSRRPYFNYYNPKTTEERQMMLLLGWVFRKEPNISAYLTESIEWMFREIIQIPQLPEHWPLPPFIMDEIVTARRKALQSILDSLEQLYQELPIRKAKICPEHHKKCAKYTVNKTIQNMKNRELYPLPSLSALEASTSLFQIHDLDRVVVKGLCKSIAEPLELPTNSLIKDAGKELIDNILSSPIYDSRDRESGGIEWRDWKWVS